MDGYSTLIGNIAVLVVLALAAMSIWVAVLLRRDRESKRELEKLQRQYRIIGAIAETFSSIFLVHLEDLSCDPISMSSTVANIYSAHPQTLDLLINILCDLVAPESREAAEGIVDLLTFDERLKGRPFLATDVKCTDGSWYSIQVIPQHRDENGKLLAVLIALRDVSAVKRAEELSYRDRLTGLRNRNYLEAYGDELIHASDYPASVVMADCNYLKRTNDTLGHEWGNELIRRVAHVIHDMAGFDNCAIRLGGDEFAIVCPNTDAAKIRDIVDRIRRGLVRASDETLTLSVSMGAVTVNDATTSLQEALDAADKIMYLEKKAAHAARE